VGKALWDTHIHRVSPSFINHVQFKLVDRSTLEIMDFFSQIAQTSSFAAKFLFLPVKLKNPNFNLVFYFLGTRRPNPTSAPAQNNKYKSKLGRTPRKCGSNPPALKSH